MRHAGVIGHPISHSLSPKIHGYWLEQYGLSGSYQAVDVPPHGLSAFLTGLLEKGWVGCNVTLPHKEAVVPFVHIEDPYTQAVGSVNTLFFRNKTLCGVNSDGYGFLSHLAESTKGHDFSGTDAVILGAGGAARGILVALKSLSFAKITVVARSREKGGGMIESLKPFFADTKIHLQVVAWEDWPRVSLENTALVVQTTPLGMEGFAPLDLEMAHLPSQAWCYDVVYRPLETPFLRQARAQGNPTIEGLGMLLYQAVVGFEIWFEKKPTVDDGVRRFVSSFL